MYLFINFVFINMLILIKTVLLTIFNAYTNKFDLNAGNYKF